MTETVVIKEQVNKVIIGTPGIAGPSGRTILNGTGAPAGNLGRVGDFYYDTISTYFYGPKLNDATWDGASSYPLKQLPTEFSFEYGWELAQLSGPTNGVYSLLITHNLGFKPNITVKSSAGDILETGITYNNNNQVTLTMAQPFSGTAYLS